MIQQRSWNLRHLILNKLILNIMQDHIIVLSQASSLHSSYMILHLEVLARVFERRVKVYNFSEFAWIWSYCLTIIVKPNNNPLSSCPLVGICICPLVLQALKQTNERFSKLRKHDFTITCNETQIILLTISLD